MDFRFTEEQQMMAQTVRGLLADLCQPADLRRMFDAGQTRDETRWTALVDLGIQGALVPEARDGLGLGAADFVLIAEACGYFALPEPLVENAGVALPLLAEFCANEDAAQLLEQALNGHLTVALAHPVNALVADAETAGALIVAARDRVYLCSSESVALVRQPSIDPFRNLFTFDAPLHNATEIAITNETRDALDLALDRGALFAAAQLLGIAQRAVDLGVAYAKGRTQFGKPIGSYQAVKHLLATTQVKIEFARPVIYAAAAELTNADTYSRARISHAKLAACEAADLACRTAVQVHGAMGYSWEVDVHFFLKRALALSSWWGGRKFHLDRVERRAFTLPLGAAETFARVEARA